MTRYIIAKVYYGSSDPWADFFAACDKCVVALSSNKEEWWNKATELVSAKPIFVGDTKPAWDEEIPDSPMSLPYTIAWESTSLPDTGGRSRIRFHNPLHGNTQPLQVLRLSRYLPLER